MSNSQSLAFAIASILAEHKAQDVLVLDLREIAGWTDFFVLGSSSSITHMRGLSRFVEEYLESEKISSLNRPVASDDESWLLQDMGDVVVHIMSREARNFYELEKLWYKAKVYSLSAGESAGISTQA
ncbi:MAG: ribosome silencing factor [Spirochaetia bacterium]|nr:ribosome silencing factor [Spirochaetia bacterium]MDD3820242.1 ribosome silencing factor [Spirochaetales bacterium]NLX45755.1 ribosome silencing factor [Treponema sp.]VBB40899.1 Ribosomal silencing factor RsfS [uncultured Spirochaetota bacterium]MCE1208511.1 ribosome silencing factor [Spirochaetia bacterium]